MKYQRFEDLPLWQAAMELGGGLIEAMAWNDPKAHRGLRDEVERAALSISNHIAEGFERGTYEDLLTFLCYARGSAGEVRSMIRFLERLPKLNAFRAELVVFGSSTESVSRPLGSRLESLQGGDRQGPRHRNDLRGRL